MRNILEQIERALDENLYYLSLFVTLTIPDICGSLDSENGKAKDSKYIRWFNDHVVPQYTETVQKVLPATLLESIPDSLKNELITRCSNPPFLTGELCYGFRCSLLHQGRTRSPKTPITRLIFVEPNRVQPIIHHNQLNDAIIIDLPWFCREVITATRQWLKKVENTPLFKKNYEKFVRLHPNGLPPYIGGMPVIG